jgi:hypothetical protein
MAVASHGRMCNQMYETKRENSTQRKKKKTVEVWYTGRERNKIKKTGRMQDRMMRSKSCPRPT